MTNDNRSRIAVIDPQKLRRAGLVRLLESWADANHVEVVAISPPAELGVGPACGMVVLSVGNASVLDDHPQLWIRSIKTVLARVPLVILSDREDRSEIRAAFREGAKGFLATSLEPPLALAALTFLYRGGSFFPASALLEEPLPTTGKAPAPASAGDVGAVIESAAAPRVRGSVRITASQARASSRNGDGAFNGHACLALTPRQREVLERLGEGKPNKVIARDLHMTEATVKVHVRQIMRKFGATNRTQAVLSAMRLDESHSD